MERLNLWLSTISPDSLSVRVIGTATRWVQAALGIGRAAMATSCPDSGCNECHTIYGCGTTCCNECIHHVCWCDIGTCSLGEPAGSTCSNG